MSMSASVVTDTTAAGRQRSLLVTGMLRRDSVDEARERHVLLAEPAGIVRRQNDLDLAVDVRPFGMVIGLVGRERDARHETPRLVEVGELEALVDRVATLDFAPALERRQRIAARLAGELCRHAVLHLCSTKLA